MISASEDCEAKAKNKAMTALHIAAIRGQCEVIASLRHARANAKAKTDDGRKPIDLANAKNMPHSSICLKHDDARF